MLNRQQLGYLRMGLRCGTLLVAALVCARFLISYGSSLPGWYFSAFSSGAASPEIEIRLFLMPLLQLICVLLLLIHWALWENLFGQWLPLEMAPAVKPKKSAPVSSAWDP